MDSYSSIDATAAWKKLRFILSVLIHGIYTVTLGFKEFFASVQVVHPYSSIDTAAA